MKNLLIVILVIFAFGCQQKILEQGTIVETKEFYLPAKKTSDSGFVVCIGNSNINEYYIMQQPDGSTINLSKKN